MVREVLTSLGLPYATNTIAGRLFATSNFVGSYALVPIRNAFLTVRALSCARTQVFRAPIVGHVVHACTSIRCRVSFGRRHSPPATADMPSGAVHDAGEISRLVPMGMIFVPSRDGIATRGVQKRSRACGHCQLTLAPTTTPAS